MKQAIVYSLKVWLTAAALSALISLIIQSLFLLPNYHPFNKINHYYDWLLQLGVITLVTVILLLPLGIVLVLIARFSLKRSSSLKLLHYIIIILLAVAPNVIFIWDTLTKGGPINTTDIGFILNAITCAVFAVACLQFFKLKSVADEPQGVIQTDVSQ